MSLSDWLLIVTTVGQVVVFGILAPLYKHLNKIRTNDLAHLDEQLKRIEAQHQELHKMLYEHLQFHIKG